MDTKVITSKKGRKVFITEKGDIESKDAVLKEKDVPNILNKGLKFVETNKKELPNVINKAVDEVKKTTANTINNTVNKLLGVEEKKTGIHTIKEYDTTELITTAGIVIVVIALVFEYSKK